MNRIRTNAAMAVGANSEGIMPPSPETGDEIVYSLKAATKDLELAYDLLTKGHVEGGRRRISRALLHLDSINVQTIYRAFQSQNTTNQEGQQDGE